MAVHNLAQSDMPLIDEPPHNSTPEGAQILVLQRLVEEPIAQIPQLSDSIIPRP